MKTNDIKKGMRIKLASGWNATMMDNKKGNIRLATVEGLYTETGSIYAHEIRMCQPDADSGWFEVELTDKQKQIAKMASLF